MSNSENVPGKVHKKCGYCEKDIYVYPIAVRDKNFCSKQHQVLFHHEAKGHIKNSNKMINYGKDAATLWKYHLRKTYNISVEEYEELLNIQRNECAICHCVLVKGNFSIDHNHNTGKVRGILCKQCNSFLGRIKDKQYIALGMYGYLTSR